MEIKKIKSVIAQKGNNLLDTLHSYNRFYVVWHKSKIVQAFFKFWLLGIEIK